MLIFLETLIAIGKSCLQDFGNIIIDNMIENIVATFYNISWHILSRRETPYVIYIYIYKKNIVNVHIVGLIWAVDFN